jgi:hypothetical protein
VIRSAPAAAICRQLENLKKRDISTSWFFLLYIMSENAKNHEKTDPSIYPCNAVYLHIFRFFSPSGQAAREFLFLEFFGPLGPGEPGAHPESGSRGLPGCHSI